MSKPLTMTVEREAWIREHGAGVTPQSWQPGVTMLRDLLAEVDALRAALAAHPAAAHDAEVLEPYLKALRSIAANTCCDGCQEAAWVAKSALAAQEQEVKP